MNELASLFLSVFSDESEAYWCFSNFMLHDTYSSSRISLNFIDETHILKTNIAHYFSDKGVSKQLAHLRDLLLVIDLELYEHLRSCGIENLYFCHEWLLLMFKRHFETTSEHLKCFEKICSHYLELHTSALKNVSVKSLYSFELFICLALLKHMRHILLLKVRNELDLYEIVRENKSLFALNYTEIFNSAEQIFEKYCGKINEN